jgi:hyaluronan synthase
MSFLKYLDDISYKTSLIFIGLLGLGLIVYVKVLSHRVDQEDSLLYFYTIAITTFQLSRLVGAILYSHSKRHFDRYIKKHSIRYEPNVSFVIPCMNEEDAIEKTITKCFEADYPKHKLEVIVINDGSTDGTIHVLNRMKEKFPQLQVVNWEKNQGKRHGMAAGFHLATGEIVVQLDSDSYIDPKTFRNIIKLFAHPEVGAVCAHADPENADTNMITRMQAAYYFVSFRILKAAESAFSTVFCCSGCSSAYRRSVVLPIIDEWLNEKFLGLPVTWGDDRAITNRVIKEGYRTVYTDEVQAYTICPDNVRKFIKQQIRWKKGWFVNSLFASKFILVRDPFVALTYFFPLIIVTLITPFMAGRALIYNPLVRGVAPWFYISGVLLVALVMTTYYRFVSRDNKYWPYVFVWSGANMFFLSFVLFFALGSIQNRKWGTR